MSASGTEDRQKPVMAIWSCHGLSFMSEDKPLRNPFDGPRKAFKITPAVTTTTETTNNEKRLVEEPTISSACLAKPAVYRKKTA
jgi:hypothetical protein